MAALAAAVALVGFPVACGGEDVERRLDEARERAEEARRYVERRVEDARQEEAADAALAVGDFDVGNSQHHGTPIERRDALLLGYRTGDPARCERYLPS
ncbi:MAG: hypothetical protein ICV69_05425 [Thermoleophilaceae bacterium]|nr:hypothetical protein [Thermoleophilaceae bacterium]